MNSLPKPVPCPKCQSTDLEICANLVFCADCEHEGPRQDGPEIVCSWIIAVNDWNEEAAFLKALSLKERSNEGDTRAKSYDIGAIGSAAF